LRLVVYEVLRLLHYLLMYVLYSFLELALVGIWNWRRYFPLKLHRRTIWSIATDILPSTVTIYMGAAVLAAVVSHINVPARTSLINRRASGKPLLSLIWLR
jgi:hypothetical protein